MRLVPKLAENRLIGTIVMHNASSFKIWAKMFLLSLTYLVK